MFDERSVHELAARRGDPLMTSFYLDVDGRRYPHAGSISARERVDSAESRREEGAWAAGPSLSLWSSERWPRQL